MRRSPRPLLMLCVLVLLAYASAAPAARSVFDRELNAQIVKLGENPAAPDAVLRLYEIDAIKRHAAWDGRVRTTCTWVLRRPDASPVLKAQALWLLAGLDRADGNLLGAAEKHRTLGLITDWLIIGPFDNEGKAGFGAEYAPEKQIDLDAACTGKERMVHWRPYPAGLGSAFVDLDAVYRPDTSVAAYALALVYSPETQDAALRFGTDDAVKIWLDGALVYEDPGHHGAVFDQAAAGVVLREGWNALLVKVTQGDGAWRFCLRITAPDGARLDGLRVEAGADNVETLLASIEPREPPAEAVVVDHPLATLKRLVEEQPDNAATHAALGALYRFTHAFDDIDELDIKAYERAIELDPDNWHYYEEVGPLYRDRNKQRDAFEKVVELNPRRAAAHAWLGRYYMQHGFYDKALAAYTAAVKADGSDYRGELGLADYKARFLHGVEAGRIIERLRRRYPATPVLVEEALRFSPFQRRDEELETLCAELLRTDAADGYALRTQLALATRRGDLDGARRVLHTMQRFNPSQTGLLVEEAELLGDAGRFDEAIALLERAVAICPEEADALEQIGRYAHWAGNDELAVEAWSQSLAFRPQNAALKEYVEHLQPEAEAFEEPYIVEVDTLLLDPPSADDYPDEGAVVMLDLQVHEVHPTGLSNLFGQRVVKILTRKGVKDFRTQYVTFTPETQEVKVQAARIYKPSGEVIEAQGPYTQPITSGPGGLYYNYSALVYAFPKLEPGDVIEFRFRRNTIAETNVYADYFGSMAYFRGSHPKQHYEVVYITPKEREFVYNSVRSDVEPTIEETGAQRIYTWAVDDLPKIKREDDMPGASEVTPYVHISTFRDVTALTDWYWGLVQDQFALDNQVKAKVAELIEGKETVADKVTAIHNWVVKNTRYIGLEFGIHGHKPYAASQVFARGYGDCKDKASLMLAMLKEAGIESDLVLLRTTDKGAVDPFPVSLAIYNHAILYVPELDLYLDGTAEFSGTGELPSGDRGASVLLAGEHRREAATVPEVGPDANVIDDGYTITLGADNDVTIEGTRHTKGEFCSYFRANFQEESKQRELLEKQWRTNVPNTELTAVEFTDLKDLEQSVSYTYTAKVPDLLTSEADGTVSFKLLFTPQKMAEHYAPLAEREHDVVFRAPWTIIKTMRYVLPEGAQVVDLPEGFETTTKHLDCTIDTTEQDGVVEVSSTVTLKSTRIPVDEYSAFRETCRTIDEKQSERIRISR